MNHDLKRQLLAVTIMIAVLLLLSSTALAQGSCDPKYIYYENEAGELVKADYSQAKQNYLDGDGTLYDALREKFRAARFGDRDIFVVDKVGTVTDYKEALDDGKTYGGVCNDPVYRVDPPPVPVKQLIVSGGVAVEAPIGDDPSGPNVEVATASALANALAHEHPVITFVADITLVDQLPAVDYPVRINLKDHEMRLDDIDFRITGQNVVVTAGRFGKIVGENGTERISTHGTASATFKGENPNTADLGVLNFQNIELLLNGTSTMTLRDVSFDRADPAQNDRIPIRISSFSTLRVIDSIYDVRVGTDVILELIGTGANSKITGNGRFHGTGKIEIDSANNADYEGLFIDGFSVGDRLKFEVHRIDIIYDRDIDLKLARLTLNSPVWLDNTGTGFNYEDFGVKVTGSLNGNGVIRGKDGVFRERLTVLNTANIDGLTFRQLRMDINKDGFAGINVRFSNAAAEPVTFAGTVHAYIARALKVPVTINRFIAANQVNVPGDLTYIIDTGSSEDELGVGSTDNIEGAGSFVGEGSITYAPDTSLTVLGNQLTFDVRQNVNEDIRFARLKLLRRVFLAADKTITVFGDLEGSPASTDRGKIIGANATNSAVVVSTTTPPVTFTHMNLESLNFNINSNTNYVDSAFDRDLTADITATLTVDNLNVLGSDVFVGGSGTFTGNRVFGLDAINFDDSAGLLVTGSSWFTFEVPIRVHDAVTFADLEFREIIYDVAVDVTVAGDLIAWQDGATIYGEIDGRNTVGEAIIIAGNNVAANTTLYNLTLNNLDRFVVVDRRVYIKDELGSTKEYPGTTNIGMDVRGDSGHRIVFFINPDTSLIVDNSIKQILQAVNVFYDGGGGDPPLSGAVRGQNGPAIIRSTGDNPITIAEGSRLLFMGHQSTNLEIDARVNITGVDRVTMGVINLKRRVTNLADNDLYVFPNKIINFHDDLILEADLKILNDMTADRPLITADRYDEIISKIQNPVQGTIRGWGNVFIQGPAAITLGDRLKVENFTFHRNLGSSEVDVFKRIMVQSIPDARKVLTLKQVVIQDHKVKFQDYLVMLEGDLRMVRIINYPELWFEAGGVANDGNIAILYGNGYKVYGDGGVAFKSSEVMEAVAQNVTFDITSTGFPYEVMIYGDPDTTRFRPIIFMDVTWTAQTTVQVGENNITSPNFGYPILRFEVKQQTKNLNNGGLRVWKDGATDQTGHEQQWNLQNPGNINYFNYVAPPGP